MNDLNNRTARRIAGVVLLGALVLGGTFATAAAFNGGSAGDAPSAPSNPATPEPSHGPIVTPAPGETGAPATPGPIVTPEPTDGGGDAMPITVDLDNATGADVYVDIVDLSGRLESAVSGQPGDGMSVEPYTLHVENVDERTLKLTWVDFPIDNALELHIDAAATRFILIQPEPTETTDAMGFDRELILTFEDPISAADIETFLQGGWDTPGE